jgi:uracil-DNA glycosylase family 4
MTEQSVLPPEVWAQRFAEAESQQLEWEVEWKECDLCPDLVERRTQVVPGYGAPASRLLFVGESPRAEEDRQGWPAVGPSGEILRSYLWAVAGLDDSEFFLTDAVMCRPTIPGKPPLKNREPKAEEIHNCQPRLQGTIYEIDPLLIIALGPVALRTLTGETTAITKARGKMFDAVIPGQLSDVMYPVLATYHPKYLRQKMKERTLANGCWAQMARDIQLAVQIYDLLKQAYFGLPIPDREAIREQRMENTDAQD